MPLCVVPPLSVSGRAGRLLSFHLRSYTIKLNIEYYLGWVKRFLCSRLNGYIRNVKCLHLRWSDAEGLYPLHSKLCKLSSSAAKYVPYNTILNLLWFLFEVPVALNTVFDIFAFIEILSCSPPEHCFSCIALSTECWMGGMGLQALKTICS